MKLNNNPLLFVLFIFLQNITYSQEKENNNNNSFGFSITANSMKIVKPIFDESVLPINEDGKTYFVRNKMRRKKFTNTKNALPKGGDPLVKRQKSTRHNKAPIVNWDGLSNSQSGGAVPPDPSGAIGPNHYVQMVNSVYRVFDRTGTPLTTPATLGSLLGGGNAGDPIVMYDKYADRWFLSQFKGYPMGQIYVAISQTPDPMGAYYLYEFDLGSFPDYPKYSIWSDGYYITSNKSGQNAFVMERDKMIAGDQSAQLIGLTIPSLSTSGFYSVLPATASSTLPPIGTPNYLFYFQDDAWAGGTDHLKVWEVNVDWNTPSNSTISSPQSLNVSPFDSQFNATWDDITQPGTSSKIDAIPGALMYMGHYRSFPNHNSIVLNHTVDVNGANLAGIRWYELRKTGSGPWTLYQEGTFSPDTENRWMGSIAMDYQGNIGLAYSVSGATTYPSLKYTGRYAGDPLGQMTLNEELIVSGTSAQTSSVRYGDYAQMTIDPLDDATFWFTGEYISNEWKTRIASFKIANDADNDIGVSAVLTPTNGILSANEQISVTITNYGTNSQVNFPVSYQINGGNVITEIFTTSLTSGSSTTYTFNNSADFSSVGSYNIKAFTSLSTDQYNNNDTTLYSVKHLGQNDVGVTAITSPSSSNTLGNNEVLTVTIENFGASTQTNIPISYQINNGTIVTENYVGNIAPSSTVSYSFTNLADFSSIGIYSVKAYTSLTNDSDFSNDTTTIQVEHSMCLPEANCLYNDGLIKFELNNILNNSACEPNGYGDFTSLSTNLEKGVTYNLKVQSGYQEQFGTLWIDFNDNFIFESNEKLIENAPFGLSVENIDLTIPSNANLGEHLLRIRTNYQANIDDPCVNVSYGETEDYTVNIIDFTSVKENNKDIKLKVMVREDNLLEIEVENLDEIVNLEIHNSIGQKIYSEKFNANNTRKVDLSNYSTGYYLIRINNEKISKISKVWIR